MIYVHKTDPCLWSTLEYCPLNIRQLKKHPMKASPPTPLSMYRSTRGKDSTGEYGARGAPIALAGPYFKDLSLPSTLQTAMRSSAVIIAGFESKTTFEAEQISTNASPERLAPMHRPQQRKIGLHFLSFFLLG